VSAPFVVGATCELLQDRDYGPALRQSVQSSARRCLCSLFIIDLKARCSGHCAAEVVDDLEDAVWRGVDVRVLIGGSRSTFAIAEAAAIAVEHLTARGIPARWLTAERGVRGSHAKTVVADETVLLGSHNWSPGSFNRDTQDSVRIASAPLAEFLAIDFESRWLDAGASNRG
jgi:phosphatidylserine/phosphatidylglycerophosphate/cardiolipin synthase-like enzyme